MLRYAAILGCLTVVASRADVTLVYGEAADTGETPAPTHQIHVSDGRVSIANAADKRLLIFDSVTGSATVVDHRARQKARLDPDGIRRLAARLAESQSQTLARIEESLAKLPKEEREALRGTVDLLHEANLSPEKLSAPIYRYEDTGKGEVLLELPASEATLFRGSEPEAVALLVTRETAGFSEGEFSALRGLQVLMDRLTRVLPPQMQSWLGSQGVLSADGRLVLRIVRGGDPAVGGGRRMELLRIDRDAVEEGWFEVPETYEDIPLERFVGGFVETPNSENVSEK